MFQKLFTTVLLVFSFSIFSFPQNDNDSDQNKQTKSAKQKKSKKIFNQIFGIGVMDLNYFLPESENAWTLSLTSSGGFAGVTRLIAAVNSNGNYLCSPNQEFRNKLLEKEVLDEIFDKIETFDFSNFDKNEENILTKNCMDCLYATLTLQTKNGFVSRTQFSFANAEIDVKQIYDRLSNLNECR
ncbi:hypothetical protein BH20ACI4_BH20ACI4_24030 [soil metagenome]